jgi:hypothetical protein
MTPQLFTKLRLISIPWFEGTFAECRGIARLGIAAGSLAVLSVFLFRPGTTTEEAALFGLVPLAVFLVGLRVIVNLGTYLPTPQKPVESDLRTKCVVRGVALCIAVAIIGIPSMLIFRWLNVLWAASFMAHFTVLLVAAVIAGATLIGTRIIQCVRLLLGLLGGVELADRKKFARC